MPLDYCAVRIPVEFHHTCGAPRTNLSVSHLVPPIPSRVLLKALVAGGHVYCDIVGGTVAEWDRWQTRVACRNAANVTGPLAGIACGGDTAESFVEAHSAVTDVGTGDTIEVVGRIVPEEGCHRNDIAFGRWWGDGLARREWTGEGEEEKREEKTERFYREHL